MIDEYNSLAQSTFATNPALILYYINTFSQSWQRRANRFDKPIYIIGVECSLHRYTFKQEGLGCLYAGTITLNSHTDY